MTNEHSGWPYFWGAAFLLIISAGFNFANGVFEIHNAVSHLCR